MRKQAAAAVQAILNKIQNKKNSKEKIYPEKNKGNGQITTKIRVNIIPYLYPNNVPFFKIVSSLSSLISDLIRCSTTTIRCFVILKLKLSGLIKLPKITKAKPVVKEVKLPKRSGISWLVDKTEIFPYKEYAEKSHTKRPAKRPNNAERDAEVLLVFFHIRDNEIGPTAEPIRIPIDR